jgi:hypothetical protein
MAPQIADTGNETDIRSWLLTVPGIPADWPAGYLSVAARGHCDLAPAAAVSFHHEADNGRPA